MAWPDVVKDKNFTPVGEVHADSKRRVPLGKAIKHKNRIYMAYENELGQIILDPMTLIPSHELWIHKEPKAIKSVYKGIHEASQGKLKKSPEDFSKYTKDK